MTTETSTSSSLPDEQSEEGAQERQGAGEQPPAVEEALLAFAQQFNEDPRQFVRRPDFLAVLDLTEKGMLIHLTIARPRFMVNLQGEQDLGIKSTPRTKKLLDQYMRYGKRSLVPKPLQDELQRVETKARECLQRHSLDTPWNHIGHFVPVTKYEEWKAENAGCERDFLALRDRLVAEYDAIVKQVLRDYRRIALEMWEHLAVRSAIVKSTPESAEAPGDQEEEEGELTDGLPTSEVQYASVLAELREEQLRAARADFVQRYLARTLAKIPSREEVARAFEYRCDRFFIPLASQLAQDRSEADRLFRERALRDAEHQAQLARIEAERRADLERIEEQRRTERDAFWAQQRLEEQERYLQVQREQEQLAGERAERQRKQNMDDLEYRMKQDLINDANSKARHVLGQFYDEIMAHIYSLTFKVCDEVLASLHQNEGRMTGSTAMRIRNLIRELEKLNFVESEQVEDQVARLREAIESEIEMIAADDTPYTRIDTGRLSRVLDALIQESDDILTELGHLPTRRSPRYALPLEEIFEAQGEQGGAVPLQIASRLSRYMRDIEQEDAEAGAADQDAALQIARREPRGQGKKKTRKK